MFKKKNSSVYLKTYSRAVERDRENERGVDRENQKKCTRLQVAKRRTGQIYVVNSPNIARRKS